MAVPMGEITRALVGVRRRLCVKWGLDAICKEHQARALTKNEKPSVLAQLKKFKEIVAAIPKKVREKKQERDL